MTGSATELSGTFANRYVIDRELGRGGTAIVYLARDLQRGHDVAVKVLRPDLQESVTTDRFLREMRLSQQLNHPHIVPVLDAGSRDGQLYFVHPFMEGGTLRARLERDRQLPLRDVVAITQTVAAALAYAHAKGVVHRDVKPENILFTSGQACLSDFGIARALEGSAGDSTTTTSVVRGTPTYMSPEQAAGERDLDARTDLYALACVVYEMIGGMQPFVGPTPQSVIAQRLTSAPQRVSVYRPSVPPAVDDVLARALAISRSDRYASVTEFADALAAATLEQATGTTRLPSRLQRMRPRLLALGVIAAAGLLWMYSRRVDAPTTTSIPEGDPRRVAVLYLDDRTPDVLPAHIADGISEDVIDQLGSIRALHVISPYGVRPFRGATVTLDSLTRVLRVGTLVTGDIARSANTVRVNVRFIDAHTGQQLDSRTLQQPWSEVFSLRDQLVAQVAFFLREQIGEQIALREQQRQTTSYAAWELTQRARADHMRAIDPRGGGATMLPLLRSADSLYALAHQFDPQWAVPTIRRGNVAAAMATQAAVGQPTPAPPGMDSVRYAALARTARVARWLDRSIALADQALARTNRSAEAFTLRGESRLRLTLLGGASDSLYPVIERDLRSAVDLRPDAAAAWVQLARLWVQEGRFADAASAAQRAADADAFYEVRGVTAIAFTATLHAEMFDAAERWCRLGLSRYKGDPRFTECELTLVGWTGRTHADVARAERLMTGIEQGDTLQMLAPTWAYRRLMVAAVMARAGLRDSARALLAAVLSHENPGSARAPSLGEAYVQHLLGDEDVAIGSLRQYLSGAPTARTQLAQHPWFRQLRADPRFQALVRSPAVTTASPGSSRSSR